MKRTAIQKAIIPRNWAFGRLAGVRNNLKQIFNNYELTNLERDLLYECCKNLTIVIDRKNISNELIKMDINNKNK